MRQTNFSGGVEREGEGLIVKEVASEVLGTTTLGSTEAMETRAVHQGSENMKRQLTIAPLNEPAAEHNSAHGPIEYILSPDIQASGYEKP
jgi:hypothetical protein